MESGSSVCSMLKRHVQMKVAERGMSNKDNRDFELCSKLI